MKLRHVATMASLFAPDVPGPDPAVAKQQKDEQDRAAAANTRATQMQLGQETILRGQTGAGIRSLLGAFGSGSSLLGSK